MNITVLKQSITGVILAGGQATRMEGQDKGLVNLAGNPMVQYVLKCLSPQVGNIIINANRNLEKYQHYGYQVVSDKMDGYCGPLAGIASTMSVIETPFLVSAPCDSPFIPADMVERMYLQMQRENAEISVAHNGERMQPVFVLLKTILLESLLAYLESGERKIDKWFRQHNLAITDFSDYTDMFLNINTPEELSVVEKKLLTQ